MREEQTFFQKMIKTLFSFEMAFTLFLFAGRFKADPRFQWIPVDLTASLFLLSTIIGLLVMANQKYKISLKAIILVFLSLFFIIYAIISLLWSPGASYATTKAFYIGTLVLWPLLASTFIFALNRERLNRFFLIIVLFAIWISVEAAFFFYSNKGSGFINVLGSNYLGVGRVVGLATLIVFGCLLCTYRTKIEKLALLTLGAFFLWVILIAGGRGPLLATFVGLSVPLFIGWSFKPQGLFVKRYVISGGAFIGAFLITLLFLIQNKLFTTTLTRIVVLFEPGMGVSAGLRLEYYLASISFWCENPIWGHGIGSWPLLMGIGDIRAYPHNIIFEIMAELGLTGLLLFLFMLFWALLALKPYYLLRSDPLKILVVMIFCNTLTNALISGDIPDNRILFAVIGLTTIKSKDYDITKKLFE